MNNKNEFKGVRKLEQLDARLAEELEERTEFCDWLSVCTSCCGGGGVNSGPAPSGSGSCATSGPSPSPDCHK